MATASVAGEWDDGGVSKQDGSGRQVSASPVDDLTATILHVDMDAFFASVELLDHPELRRQARHRRAPVARSVVTAATYEARKYGVNSAMPMAVALRRCPQAIVLEPHFERYAHWSGVVMGSARRRHAAASSRSASTRRSSTSPAPCALLGTPWQIGTALRERVHAETGLHCSVGAAATKFVAKLASSRAKPDGLLVVPAAETARLPASAADLARSGASAARPRRLLPRLGMRTVGDLADTPLDTLRARDRRGRRGAAARARRGARPARGVARPRREERRARDRPSRPTRPTPISSTASCCGSRMRSASRLRRAGVAARTVVLKLRFEDFTTITRSRTLAEPTDLGRRIYEESRDLYDAANPSGRPVRLIGVRGEQLSGAVASLGLWDDDEAVAGRRDRRGCGGHEVRAGRANRPATLLSDKPDTAVRTRATTSGTSVRNR